MRVLALGAFCDARDDAAPAPSAGRAGRARRAFRSRYRTGPHQDAFAVSEFAVLADGRRVTLRQGLGWTEARLTEEREPAADDRLDRESLVQTVLRVVEPDDEDDPDDHPYEWLARVLQQHGVFVEASDLRGVPYSVELSPRLQTRLAGG